MTTDTAELDQALASHELHADPQRLQRTFAQLRRDDPVHWTQPQGHPPFWAITKHADIVEIGKNSAVFVAEPQTFLRNDEETRIVLAETQGTGKYVRTLIHMDEPEHKKYRGLTQSFFMPNNIKRLDGIIQDRARALVQKMVDHGGRCDFYNDIAVWYPLQIMMTLMAVPDSDHAHLLRLTQQFLAPKDPTLRRNEEGAGYKAAVMKDYAAYFMKLLHERRARPGDDLASLIAQSAIDGEPIGDMEGLSYYVILATAGHDTTSSSMGSGLYTLLSHPAELARLRANPQLMGSAVEEMLRFAAPVKHFVRTATEDFTLRGKTLRKGDAAALFYQSANFDEDVFEDAQAFKIDRTPNREISFGFGIHACLGQNLARTTMKVFFAELLRRIDNIEMEGEPEFISTNQVGGLKKLNVRFTAAAVPA